jgi:predicted ribosome quality control (RQC) complex YloA/Tae2 family protein
MVAEGHLGSKGRGHRAYAILGFEVLVGKGDAENDALTFGVAEPRDFWLHVAGPAGSHVVVRNPDELAELPRAVLEAAAALAAATPTSASLAASTPARSCSAAGSR